RVDLGGREVDEARLVQHRKNAPSLLGGKRSRRAEPRRERKTREPRAVEGRSRQSERRAHREHAQNCAELENEGHQRRPPFSSVAGSGIPRRTESFFWTSMIASAWAARTSRRWLVCSSSTMRLSLASGCCGCGRRLLATAPAIPPRSRASRHPVMCDEY